MPEKTFDGYIAEVKKRKADAAQGIAKDHAARAEHRWRTILRCAVRQGSAMNAP
jgi:hypothetical protein